MTSVFFKRTVFAGMLAVAAACEMVTPDPLPVPVPSETASERIILLNEGNWQSDNGQLSYVEDHAIVNGWYRKVNGDKLGDTPQHIIQLNDTLLAVSVNWSNIIRYIKPDGRLVASTENVPNCRYMATDSTYLYITSYAHRTALGESYTKGYVAKIDLETYAVVATCEVGYEPDGLACFNGRLYVANSGGYAFSENHEYENTVSVLDAGTMTKIDDVEILDADGSRLVNLYGMLSRSGRYLCINSAGQYGVSSPATVIFDCEDNSYTVHDVPSTTNTVLTDGRFFTVGASFSAMTGQSEYVCSTIDPVTGDCFDCYLLPDDDAPDAVMELLGTMSNPYCVYQNPYTGHLYITDAAGYASSGRLYEFDERGVPVGKPLATYMCPGHMIALPPVKQ